MKTLVNTWLLGLGWCALFGLAAATAQAGSHTWDVNEVFSNADGSVQFVELLESNGTPNETGVPGHTLSSNGASFVITGPALASPSSNKSYLIATPGFASIPGAPTPDATIPPGSVPFASAGGDTIAYEPWDTLVYGAGLLPTDGVNSLNRDLTTGVNSPKNYAGVEGSVSLGPLPAPALPEWGLLVLATLLALAGCSVLIRSRRARAA